ncbi:hypothetical protein B0G81_3961 [Paraburkholderia sp. BL6665CI2N2]|uniref:hypothetical protein n=1 Tax=Paraburkholderia sp. BL6665CI2N2 TaxID=1938806 RepID=UPI001065FBEF|nr:hypothetical protein [Paraburkholderia sp. BL6665CI2N2]TDY23579.1 hypothetical protein B0G81_3961 [Paraburkholderia sp. BL6665CI2N2]
MTINGYIRPRDGLKAIDLTEERPVTTKREAADDAGMAALREPLKRFVRSRVSPAELEALRYRLIQARVMNGFTFEEAAARFASEGPVDVARIESGEIPTPKDWRFLKHTAEAYAVSVDWLLGLSPNMEPDAVVLQQHALLRGVENMMAGVLNHFIEAGVRTARETRIGPDEVDGLLDAIDVVATRFKKFAAQEGFEDYAGGAPVLAAIQSLAASVGPLRRMRGQFHEFRQIVDAVAAGRLMPVPGLDEYFLNDSETM